MKISGFEKEKESLIELQSITLEADPETLRGIAAFLTQCADEIESDPTGWEHEHLGDYLSDKQILLNSDIVVWNDKDRTL